MKITPIPLYVLILVCLSFDATSQSNLDSLYAIWENAGLPDSARVEAFKSYIWEGYLNSQPDSAIALAEQMVSFSNAADYPRGEAIGLRALGIISRIKGDYGQAVEYYKRSLKIAEKHGAHKEVSLALNNIGNIYYNQDNYPAALDYYQRSLKINEEINGQMEISLALNNIGNVYFDQGDLPRALEHYQRSLRIRQELDDKAGIATSLATIGSVYSSQGDYAMALEYFQSSLKLHEEIGDKSGVADNLNNIGILSYFQGDYTTALTYYQRSLKIAEEFGAQREMADDLNNIGVNYASQNDFTNALRYYRRSLKIREELADQGGIATSLYNIGSIHEKQGDYPRALDFCKRGLKLADEIGLLVEQKGACQCLYDTYKAMGKGNEALVYLEKLNAINDSLNLEKTTKKLQQMEFAKELLQDSIANAEEKRLVEEAHQETLRKESRTRNILAVSGFILLLISGGFYSRWRYVKRSRAVLQIEKDRSENLLLNILPAEIAEELKKHGRSEARDFEMVSILFTDFKSFTETSAKLSASELVNEINHCFEAFDGIIEKYNVEKIKTIGDAYMAVGGLPIPSDDAVKNTVFAALDMQALIEKRKAENDALGKPAFEMRVGIHTGPVVAGIVGVKKFQYDIWGDTVNTASRMESNGEAGKVNISQATYTCIQNDPDFVFERRGMIAAKGKGEMEMWFVRSTKPLAGTY